MIPIKKILCPVDFFPASKNAARYAAALAADHGAKLKLLHVVYPFIPAAYEFPLNTASVAEVMGKGSKREMTRLLAKLKSGRVPVETEIRTGDIFTNIKRVIAVYKPDLIAMGTHGRHGFERWFMGSITERLLRHSTVPLLTISSSRRSRVSDGKFRRILITTDFSEGTPDALNYGLSIAEKGTSRVTLMHVLDDLRAITSPSYKESLARRVRRKLLELVPPFAKDCCNVDARVEAGTPYHAILRTIKEEQVDLVVMNIHGKGMLDRALLGATAERIVRAAACPVLLIPKLTRTAKMMRGNKQAA